LYCDGLSPFLKFSCFYSFWHTSSVQTNSATTINLFQ
jgi:hypothetical protein